MSESANDFFEESDEPKQDGSWCNTCQGEGKITTDDFESYLGAMYKPCPVCASFMTQSMIGEPPLS